MLATINSTLREGRRGILMGRAFTTRTRGSYDRTRNFLRRNRFNKEIAILEKYGQLGVNELMEATPVDTGKTASSWYYEIVRNSDGRISLNFCNTNVNGYVKIAMILQFGHATKNGFWVEGRDYINPVIQPIFDKIADMAWKEITR